MGRLGVAWDSQFFIITMAFAYCGGAQIIWLMAGSRCLYVAAADFDREKDLCRDYEQRNTFSHRFYFLTIFNCRAEFCRL